LKVLDLPGDDLDLPLELVEPVRRGALSAKVREHPLELLDPLLELLDAGRFGGGDRARAGEPSRSTRAASATATPRGPGRVRFMTGSS
jgi:hypothetical protein